MINITLADGYTEKQLMKEVKDRANETDKKITKQRKTEAK